MRHGYWIYFLRIPVLGLVLAAGRGRLVRNHFANVGDVLLDSVDFLWPGNRALVRYSGGILSLSFGEDFEGVLQLLFKRGAGHRGKVIT